SNKSYARSNAYDTFATPKLVCHEYDGLELVGIDRDRSREIIPDDEWPQHMRTKAPPTVVAPCAACFEVRDHGGRSRALVRRFDFGAIKAPQAGDAVGQRGICERAQV